MTPQVLRHIPFEQRVLTATEAAEFLRLPSPKAVQRLIDDHRLTPVGVGKSNTFWGRELLALVERSTESERMRRGTP